MKINKNIGDNHMKRARQINFDTQGDVYVRVPSDLKKNNYKQMKTAEQNKIKLRKMDLDKKYIARKLVEISKNSPIIFSNLRKFKSKCKTSYKYKIFTHEKHLIKLLKINQRTIRLLRDEEYIRYSVLVGISIYVLSDIYNFLRANNKYQKRKSG